VETGGGIFEGDLATMTDDIDIVAAKRAIAEYHKDLNNRLFEIESKFDNATLLVAGGAFTISAGFLQKIDATLVAPVSLAISWLMWGLCLALGVGGHLRSRATGLLIRFLAPRLPGAPFRRALALRRCSRASSGLAGGVELPRHGDHSQLKGTPPTNRAPHAVQERHVLRDGRVCGSCAAA
jgi:hypothetical protein